MAESSTQLLTRIAILLEQLIITEKDEEDRLELLARNGVVLDQHGVHLSNLIERAEEIVRQRLTDQAEIRALIEALRVNVRHDTANLITPLAIKTSVLVERKDPKRIDAVEHGEENGKTPRFVLRGSVPLKTVIFAIGSMLSIVSGWIWAYRESIAKVLP